MVGLDPTIHADPQGQPLAVPADILRLSPVQDVRGLIAARYALEEGACILFRPDQHVAARFHRFDPARIARAIHAAMGARQHEPA